MIRLRINGEIAEVEGKQSVATIVAARGGDTSGVAVAVNGHVVPRRAWQETRLADGDDLLLVRPVAGGAWPVIDDTAGT